MSIDPTELVRQRRARLEQVMAAHGVPALLTCDPITVRYATGTRNMLVHGLTGPDRLALVIAGGPTILWEFAGCEHLTADAPFVDSQRPAPGLSAKKTPDHAREVAGFAAEVAAECGDHVPAAGPLAIERLDLPVTDALRSCGVDVADGMAVTQAAMAIKQPAEVTAMRSAMQMTHQAATTLEAAIQPGASEQEVWAQFHQALIAGGGELVVTRLLQAGERTFPYFLEASCNRMHAGDLVCFDSDAVAAGGYSVDFSRTFLCGDQPATSTQHHLYGLALEQLEHNASNLGPGVPFEEFARRAFEVSEPYARYGYYQLAHGLGMAGGHPNVPRIDADRPYPLPGAIEAGMVLCVESYIGDPASKQGIKLENQYLIRDDSVEQMSTYPLDDRLMRPPR